VTGEHSPQWDDAPTVEVRVFRHGVLVHQELCESEEQAALVVDEWSELDGVQCEVDDMSAEHGADDNVESEPVPAGDDDHRDSATDRYLSEESWPD